MRVRRWEMVSADMTLVIMTFDVMVKGKVIGLGGKDGSLRITLRMILAMMAWGGHRNVIIQAIANTASGTGRCPAWPKVSETPHGCRYILGEQCPFLEVLEFRVEVGVLIKN